MTGHRTRHKESAGLLLFRRGAVEVEVLLAHPGGPYWVGRNEAAWITQLREAMESVARVRGEGPGA